MASCTTFMPSICSCRKPEPSTSWIVATSTLHRLYVLHQAGAFFVTRSQVEQGGMLIDVKFGADGSLDRHHLRPVPSPWTASTPVRITPNFCGASASRTPSPLQDAGLHHQDNFSLPAATICALYKSRWQVELFFKWIKQHLRIKQFYGTSENAVKTQIWIAVSVYVLVAILQEARSTWTPRSTLCYSILIGDPLRENAHTSSTCGRRKQPCRRFANNQPIEFIRFSTGH